MPKRAMSGRTIDQRRRLSFEARRRGRFVSLGFGGPLFFANLIVRRAARRSRSVGASLAGKRCRLSRSLCGVPSRLLATPTTKAKRAMGEQELCAKCGVPLYGSPALRPARLCPRHLAEVRVEAGPVACTDADLREGPTADEPCPRCGHAKRSHGWDGCEQHITVFSYGELVHDGACGCQEWDPMCTAVESGEPATGEPPRVS
jgi:ribosomal protein L34E